MSEPVEATPDRTDKSWRMRTLLGLLAEGGRLTVAEATAALGVSEATVRRDFATLADQHLATRTHGGLVASSVAYDLPVRYRSDSTDEKDRIGAAVAALVQPGQVVGFNGGTTTTAAARQVAARPDLAALPDNPAITIVTNALNIATELVLRPHVRTVSIGGVARPQSYEVVGPLAHLVLSELWLDHLVLGVDGLDAASGASCFHEGEASINAVMVQRAKEVTVVSGAAKLGRRSFARICDTSAINRLVTDETVDPEVVAQFRTRGVEVVVV